MTIGALDRSIPVAVIGAGTMGAGIAQVAAAAGHPVYLMDMVPGAVTQALDGVAARLSCSVEKGRVSAAARDALLGNLKPASNIAELANAGLVIEAVVEELGAKQALFAKLEAVLDDGAILATNTSSLSVTAIASTCRLPARVVGMHFFNPAPVMALVEVVSGLATSSAVADVVQATAKAWGKAPAACRSTPGFIVNRVARPFYGEALRLVEEGIANPVTVDALLTGGAEFRMGPFALMDLIGIDVNLAANEGVWAGMGYDPRYAPTALQREMVAAGHLGRKTGRGYFDYTEGATSASPDFVATAPMPAKIVLRGIGGFMAGLSERLAAADIEVTQQSGSPALIVDDFCLRESDGRSATIRWMNEDERADVLFDHVPDWATASAIAISGAAQADQRATLPAAALFQAVGMDVVVVGDGAGLVVLRTMAMIANEAVSVVETGVCRPGDVDLAMRMGTNWPRGPLAWGDTLDNRQLLTVMENLFGNFGSDRYRPQALLRRTAAAGATLS